MLEHVPGTAIAREAYTPQFSQDEYRLRGSYFLPQRSIDDYLRSGVRYSISSDRTVERYLTSSGGPASTGYSQVYRLPEVFRVDPSATETRTDHPDLRALSRSPHACRARPPMRRNARRAASTGIPGPGRPYWRPPSGVRRRRI